MDFDAKISHGNNWLLVYFIEIFIRNCCKVSIVVAFEPRSRSLREKTMKTFMLEAAITIVPFLQLALLIFLPCTKPFLLSMLPTCKSTFGQKEETTGLEFKLSFRLWKLGWYGMRLSLEPLRSWTLAMWEYFTFWIISTSWF